MKECIEIEYSYEYAIGYNDGIESFRPKFEEIVKNISDMSCDGCVHRPEDGENYDEPCGTCRRFYGDYFEPKEMV